MARRRNTDAGELRGIQAMEFSEAYFAYRPEAMALFALGNAPSEIDARLGLPDGMARELIVSYWFRGKR